MRYSDYLNQVNVRHRTINHNLLTALAKRLRLVLLRLRR